MANSAPTASGQSRVIRIEIRNRLHDSLKRNDAFTIDPPFCPAVRAAGQGISIQKHEGFATHRGVGPRGNEAAVIRATKGTLAADDRQGLSGLHASHVINGATKNAAMVIPD